MKKAELIKENKSLKDKNMRVFKAKTEALEEDEKFKRQLESERKKYKISLSVQTECDRLRGIVDSQAKRVGSLETAIKKMKEESSREIRLNTIIAAMAEKIERLENEKR